MVLSDNLKTGIITVAACFYVYLTGSILFGWPALYPILVDEGQYNELCVPASSSVSLETNTSSLSSGSTSGTGVVTCEAQKVRTNLVFTIGYLFVGVSNLCGILTDRIGPMLSNILGSLCVISGLIMWAFSDSKTLDMWIPGAIFVGLGESITYYANFHVVNLLTKYRTLVVSLISGIWNAGGLNMCIVQFIYFKFGVPRRTSLMVSASIVITMFLITTIFLCPIRGYLPGDKPKIRPVWVTIREYLNEKKEEKAKKINIELAGSSVVTSAEEKENEGEKVSEADDDNEKEAEEEEEEVVDGEENPHPFKYFLKHVFTKHFLAVLLYSIFCGYSISYGLGTIEYQYYDLTTKHEFYDQLFSIVASLGLVIIPLWSWMIDKIGLYAFGISLMVMDMFFYGALMIPSMPVYVVNFFIFSFIRVTVGVGVSNYNRMFFDVSLFGSFTGFVWFLIGVTSQVQNPMVSFVLNKLHGNWLYPNLILMFTPLFALGFIILAYKHEKGLKAKKAKKSGYGGDNDDEETKKLISSTTPTFTPEPQEDDTNKGAVIIEENNDV